MFEDEANAIAGATIRIRQSLQECNARADGLEERFRASSGRRSLDHVGAMRDALSKLENMQAGARLQAEAHTTPQAELPQPEVNEVTINEVPEARPMQNWFDMPAARASVQIKDGFRALRNVPVSGHTSTFGAPI